MKTIGRILGERPMMEHAGSNVNLTITSTALTLTILESGQVVACHDMPNISFASGGDPVRFGIAFWCSYLLFDVSWICFSLVDIILLLLKLLPLCISDYIGVVVTGVLVCRLECQIGKRYDLAVKPNI